MSNTVKCPVCDFANVPIKFSPSGSASGACPDCKAQVFAKSPKAADALKRKMGTTVEAAPAVDVKNPGLIID